PYPQRRPGRPTHRRRTDRQVHRPGRAGPRTGARGRPRRRAVAAGVDPHVARHPGVADRGGAAMTLVKPFYGGTWQDGASTEPLRDKYSGASVGALECAGPGQVDEALTALAAGFAASRWEPYDRFRALTKAADLLLAQRDEFVATIVADSGFTVT